MNKLLKIANWFYKLASTRPPFATDIDKWKQAEQNISYSNSGLTPDHLVYQEYQRLGGNIQRGGETINRETGQTTIAPKWNTVNQSGEAQQAKVIQHALNSKGAALKEDGIWGPLSHKSLVAWQSNNNDLPADGKFHPGKTLNMLGLA